MIIKLGALGDVLRTTPLLRAIPGPVTWVTEDRCLPLLDGNPRIRRLLPLSAASSLRAAKFDRVINFDEDPRACELAASIAARRRVGAWSSGGLVRYCAGSAPWFDMSLVSRLGRRAADRLKSLGRRAYQDYLFAACGRRFSGEEYVLPVRPVRGARVAVEARAGDKWPSKAWAGFPAATRLLRDLGVECFALRPRRRLADYIDDINSARAVLAGDTLGMHVALALRKTVVALFTCTSPHEIHGYGRLTKVVDPALRANFYRRDRRPSSLSAEDVASAVLRAVNGPDNPRGGPAGS